MAEAVMDSGRLASGEETHIDNVGFIAEEGLEHVYEQIPHADVDADADEFDFQLDDIGTNEDAEDTDDQHHQRATDISTAAVDDKAESEIGYEDEDEEPRGDTSVQAAAQYLESQSDPVEHDAETKEEPSREGADDVVFDDVSLDPPQDIEPNTMEELADQEHHPTPGLHHENDEHEPYGDLDLDPELRAATESGEHGYEGLDLQDETEPSPGHREPGAESGQSPSTQDDAHPSTIRNGSGVECGAPYRPDVNVVYNNIAYELCAKEHNDDPNTYFFAGDAELGYPLSRFLFCLREVISNEIASGYEVVVRLEQLNLEFGENSKESFLKHTTFRDILDLYRKLQQNDGVAEYSEPIVELLTRPDCEHRFFELSDAANDGTGLSELLEDLDQSESSQDSSPVKEAMDDEELYNTIMDDEGQELDSNELEGEHHVENFTLEDESVNRDGFPDVEGIDAGMGDAVDDEEAFVETVSIPADDSHVYLERVELVQDEEHLMDKENDDEDEIDYQELEDEGASGDNRVLGDDGVFGVEGVPEDEQVDHGTAYLVDEQAASEHHDVGGDEDNLDVLPTDEGQHHDSGYFPDSVDYHPDQEVAIGNDDMLDDGTGKLDRTSDRGGINASGDEAGGPQTDGASDAIGHDDTTTAQPEFQFDFTGEYEGENEQEEQEEHGDAEGDEGDEDYEAIENSEPYGEIPSTGVDVGAPSKVTQGELSSPTSTIKGDEINLVENLEEEDGGFLIDLQETEASSAQNVDEIDWDHDGDDLGTGGDHEKESAKLTSSGGSIKRSRQPDDAASLADESDVKRRRT